MGGRWRNRHFDAIASLYDRILHRSQHDDLVRLLDLPVPGRLLDAGGGTGRASASLRPLTGGIVVTDLSRPMLRQTRGKEDLVALQARTEALPFGDGLFDRVIVVDALHHFADRRAALAELARVLNPGGRLLVEEPDLTTAAVKVVALLEKLFLMESHFVLPEVLIGEVAGAGLSPHPVEHDVSFRFWIVADKPL